MSTINRASTSAPMARAAATTDASQMEGVKSAKELLEGGFSLGSNKDSKIEAVAESLARIGGQKGIQYARMIDGLGKGFKGRALEGIQKDMGEWLKANPNATPEQVFAQSSKVMAKHTMVNMQFKQTIDQMASDAINRMKDTFEG